MGIDVIACLGRWDVGQGKDDVLRGAYLSPYPHTWTYGTLCAHFVTTEHEHSRTVKRCGPSREVIDLTVDHAIDHELHILKSLGAGEGISEYDYEALIEVCGKCSK